MPLPGEPQILNARTCQAQLHVCRQDQPTPAVSLLRMTHSRDGPPQGLFEEAEGVLQVESADVGAPKEIEVRLSRASPPQPQLARLAGRTRQPRNLHQHEGAPDDGSGPTGSASRVVLGFGMELRPGSYAHRPIARILAVVLDGGLGPCLRIFGVQLRAVTTRAPGLGWRSYRVGVEAGPARKRTRVCTPPPSSSCCTCTGS